MTPADTHVKNSMLTYPSIFPTRIAVLEHNLVVLGNGMDWQEDGTLGDRFSERKPNTTICMEDLDERLLWWEGRLAEYNNREDGSPSNYNIQKFYRDGIEQNAKERQERLDRQNNIDVLASTVDPNAKLKGSYGLLENIIHDLFSKNYTGLPYLTLWNIPQNVEKSWWNAACEVVEAAIRGSNSPDDRNYMRMIWEAMTDFVEGRAESFVVPARPETLQERVVRLYERDQLRHDAYEQAKEIERVINRAGYKLNMKSKNRNVSYSTNGTFGMSIYELHILTDEIIGKIDKAMVKRGYTRYDDDQGRITWENGKEHRVALRLCPYAFEGLYEARVLVVGHPEDKDSKDYSKRGWYNSIEKHFNNKDARGRYAVIVPSRW